MVVPALSGLGCSLPRSLPWVWCCWRDPTAGAKLLVAQKGGRHTIRATGQLAVAWALSHPAVQVALVGARDASQLDETVRAGDVQLSQQDRSDIDQILS